MRHWRPSSEAAAAAVRNFAPDRIVLLPLYPQFSTTTTASSLREWHRAATSVGLKVPTSQICCYPAHRGFISALGESVRETSEKRRTGISYRFLFSAHGLPERVIRNGDPYQWQIEQSVSSVVEELGMNSSEKVICYQSRVGSLRWIGPATDEEIRRAGAEGLGVVVAPVSFVSEHAETLVELDMDYARLAEEAGVPHFLRAPTVSVRRAFIEGLADLVLGAGGRRYCPAAFAGCGFRETDP
jgi:ferrochelatase